MCGLHSVHGDDVGTTFYSQRHGLVGTADDLVRSVVRWLEWSPDGVVADENVRAVGQALADEHITRLWSCWARLDVLKYNSETTRVILRIDAFLMFAVLNEFAWKTQCRSVYHFCYAAVEVALDGSPNA